MDQKIIDLYDEYTHAPLARRVFMRRLAAMVGGYAAATALLPLLEAGGANAQMIAPDDDRLMVERTAIARPGSGLDAYVARPNDDARHAAVVVIHENRGLNAHIEDVARRLAIAGYVAVAPDLLSADGGTPEDSDQARAMIAGLDQEAVVADLVAAVAFARDHDAGSGKVGAVGFCWGGGMAGRLAAARPGLDGCVIYYGPPPSLEQAKRIRCPLLLHYAGLDQRINADVPAFEAALTAAGIEYEAHMYEGVNHAFNNDTAPARYAPEAAELAWGRTLAFFERTLA